MTKQGQIEEMASNVENALHNHCRMLISCNCNDCEFLKYRTPKTDCQAICIAKNLYNAGYRKVAENAVILTPEERDEEMKADKYEAVKEFAERVKMAFYYEFDEIIPSIMSDKIDELLKEYEK